MCHTVVSASSACHTSDIFVGAITSRASPASRRYIYRDFGANQQGAVTAKESRCAHCRRGLENRVRPGVGVSLATDQRMIEACYDRGEFLRLIAAALLEHCGSSKCSASKPEFRPDQNAMRSVGASSAVMWIVGEAHVVAAQFAHHPSSVSTSLSLMARPPEGPSHEWRYAQKIGFR